MPYTFTTPANTPCDSIHIINGAGGTGVNGLHTNGKSSSATNGKVKRNSLVEMLAKVPVTDSRGSLLTALEKLLKTIDVSESAIMIPTLLRDKCEFDAQELLIIAKIIKASILGHSDLVEFYMNHIHTKSCQESSHLNVTSVATTPAAVGTPMIVEPSGARSPFESSQSTTSIASSSSSTSSSSSASSSLSLASSLMSTTSGMSSNSLSQSNANMPAPPAVTPIYRTVQPPTLLQLANGSNNNNNNNNNNSNNMNLLVRSHWDQRLSLSDAEMSEKPQVIGVQVSTGTNTGTTTTPTNVVTTLANVSGAPSPSLSGACITPTTVSSYPRAETLDTRVTHGLPGDPCVSAKLLQQIEQLKVSILNVTNLLESVVELYKRSVDDIAS